MQTYARFFVLTTLVAFRCDAIFYSGREYRLHHGGLRNEFVKIIPHINSKQKGELYETKMQASS